MSAPARRRGGLWRQRDFGLFWTGESISEVGNSVTIVVTPLVAIETLHTSTFIVTVLNAAIWLPWLIIGVPAGAWVDRLPPRPVMLTCDAISMAAYASVPVAAWLGVLTVAQLIAVTLIAGAATVFFRSAYQVLLPGIVDQADLPEGNAKLIGSREVAQIAGPGLGGALAQIAGPAIGLLADAASFAISFTCLTAVRRPRDRRATAPRTSSLTQEARHGLRFLWHDPYLRVMASFSALANLALTGVDALIVVFLVRTLGLSAAAAGLVVASFGIGGVTGALVARPLGQRFGTARALLIADAGGLSFALLLPLAHAGPSLAFAVISMILVACGVVAANIIGASFRQTYVPPDMLGRVSSVTMTVAYAMMPAGALLAGLLAITLGIRPALWILTALISASGLLYLPTPIRRLRDLPLNWPATGKSGSTIRYGAAVTAPANGKLRPSGGTQAPCQHHPGWVGHRGPGGRCHAPAAAGRLSAAEEAARSRYGSPVGSGSETAAEPGAGLGLRGSRAPAPPPRPR